MTIAQHEGPAVIAEDIRHQGTDLLETARVRLERVARGIPELQIGNSLIYSAIEGVRTGLRGHIVMGEYGVLNPKLNPGRGDRAVDAVQLTRRGRNTPDSAVRNGAAIGLELALRTDVDQDALHKGKKSIARTIRELDQYTIMHAMFEAPVSDIFESITCIAEATKMNGQLERSYKIGVAAAYTLFQNTD